MNGTHVTLTRVCPTPYTTANEPGAIPCGITYADSLGQSFQTARAIFVTFTTILFVVTYIQSARLIYYRGISPIVQMHGIYFFLTFSVTTQFIRAPDLQGWGALMPREVNQVLSDMSSASIICLSLLVTVSWLKLMRRIVGKTQTNKTIRYVEWGMPTFLVIFTLIISFLQADVHTPGTWLFSVIKFAVFMAFIIAFITIGWTQGAPLFLALNRGVYGRSGVASPASKSRTIPAAASPTVPTAPAHQVVTLDMSPRTPGPNPTTSPAKLLSSHAPHSSSHAINITADEDGWKGASAAASPHQVNIEMMERELSGFQPKAASDITSFTDDASAAASSAPYTSSASPATPIPFTPPAHASSGKRKAKMTRIIKLMTAATLLAVLAIAFMITRLAGDLSSRYDDRDNPKSVPTSSTIFVNLAFPVVEYIACCIVLAFFRHMKPYNNNGRTTSGGSTPQQTSRTTQKTLSKNHI